MRPRIGSAPAIASSRSPICSKADRPRAEIARLIERPRSAPFTRGSERRSYTVHLEAAPAELRGQYGSGQTGTDDCHRR